MGTEFKVGQRIDVFECLKNKDLEGYLERGSHAIGVRHAEMPTVTHIAMIGTHGGLFTLWDDEFKKVGTLVIKSLKGETAQ